MAALSMPDEWYEQRQAATVERLAAKYRRLLQQFAHGHWDGQEEAFDAIAMPLKAELDAARQAVSERPPMQVIWHEATPAQREKLLQEVMETVILNIATGAVVAFKPRPAFVLSFRAEMSFVEDANGFFYAETE